MNEIPIHDFIEDEIFANKNDNYILVFTMIFEIYFRDIQSLKPNAMPRIESNFWTK